MSGARSVEHGESDSGITADAYSRRISAAYDEDALDTQGILEETRPFLPLRTSIDDGNDNDGDSGHGHGNGDDNGDDNGDEVDKDTASPTVAHHASSAGVLTQQHRNGNDVSLAEANGSDPKPKPVTWLSLPRKGQLAILTLARLSEPLAERSFSAYMFAQLSWFDPELSPATITTQGGMLTSAFAAAQFVTAVVWGRAADSPRLGRKAVLLVGLTGTAISLVGIGFSKSFTQVLCWRLLSGALNGNVGVLRTMISEIISEKKFQSRAFLLLPMCFNVGVVIGPLMGGFLADPVRSMPGLFGPGGSLFGGQDGVGWMMAFPYALPSLVGAMIVLSGALLVLFGLEETHLALKDEVDFGRKLRSIISGMFSSLSCYRHPDSSQQPPTNNPPYRYSQLSSEVTLTESGQNDITGARTLREPPPVKQEPAKLPKPPPFRQIFTRNVVLTLLNNFILAFHVSIFNSLIFLLLPAPSSANKHVHLPFFFNGGLGLSTEQLGLATTVIGIVGLPLQLLVYPTFTERLGTLASFKLFLPFSILSYALLPYLSLLPSLISRGSLSAWTLWPCLWAVLTLQVISRTFALPSNAILVNNCSPGRECLGTIHGVGQSVSSGARMIGPLIGGAMQGWGLKNNCIGAVWWGMACVAGANWALLWAVREGA